ncbi:transporter [Vibrio ishigakensis]|uniref:transporter n=1 Tax=Vibrio ishigakensis TaxID=1481914 RepID=UPI0021C4AD52|nr:transporter [Vibrio ishigakensis]
MLGKPIIGCATALLLLGQSAFAEDGSEVTLTVSDVIEKRGVLSPKGTWSLETSLSFTQNSSNRVSVVGYTVLPTLIIGRIEVSDADYVTATLGLTARLGLTNATEFELRLPYVYRNNQTTVRPIQDGSGDNDIINRSNSGGDIGDLELGLRHQFNFDTTPYWIGGIRLKTRTGRSPYDIDIDETTNTLEEVSTGSGFWSLEPSLTMLYPSDPAVLFANISYIYNIKDKVDVNGQDVEVDLGDTISIGGGMGFAVNPDLSFSLGVTHKTILKSKVDGRESDDAKLLHLDSLNVGVNLRLNQRSSLNVSAQAGLTEDSPDFQLTVRVPYYF